MGKFLGGCAIVVVVLVLGAAVGGYFIFVKPYTDMAGQVVAYGEEYQALEASVDNQAPYRAPPDQAITESQLQQLLAVHAHMRERLAGDLETLETRYRQLEEERERGDRELGLRDMMGAYRDLGELYMEGKRAQVEALNDQGLSLAEYHWIRNQVYAALGQGVAVATLADQPDAQPRLGSVPQESVALVEQHREALLETYAFAWFGL